MRTSRTTRAGSLLLGILLASASAAPIARAQDAVTTKPPVDVSVGTATLRASALVSLLGATVRFQYGPSTAYGAATPPVATTLIGQEEPVATAVGGLVADTTYHVRAVLLGGALPLYGRDISFTTTRSGTAPGASGTATGGAQSATTPAGTNAAPAADATTASSATPASSSTPASTSPDIGPGGDASDPAIGDGDPAAAETGLPGAQPQLGQSIAVRPVDGTITVQAPAGSAVGLTAERTLPTGTIIDATRGAVLLTTALDRKGTRQAGRFSGAIFEVRQHAGDRGLTQLVLRGGSFARCAAGAATPTAGARVAGGPAAHAATRRKPIRSLWGSDHHGRFQIHGRGSVATVRGTRWRTEDWCQGTTTRVVQGAVAVHDLARHTTVLVRRGHHYLARIGATP